MFRLTEALAWTSIFPYVYLMIQSFHEVSESETAFFAGAMVATFTFCEFLTGFLWGKVSDRIGRKPTLLIGTIGGMAAATTLGFSKSLFPAMLSRAIGGLTNPNVGVVQCCVSETVRHEEHQGIVPVHR